MTFAQRFREHVTPRLARACRYNAGLLVCGLQDWAAAHWAVMGIARHYGAAHLPAHLFEALDDWITTTLLSEMARMEAATADIDALADALPSPIQSAADWRAWQEFYAAISAGVPECPTTSTP